jgi:hypothetical protein
LVPYTFDVTAGAGTGFPFEPGCQLRLGARSICVEVTKQNVSPPPPGGGPTIPPNAGSVFLSYKVKCPKQFAPTVGWADQFGLGAFTASKVSEILVPAAPGPANDHFECYKAKDTRPKATYVADLAAGVAGFLNETGCTVRLGAKRVCVQATLGTIVPSPPGGGPGPGPDAPQVKFISYKLKCPKAVVPPVNFDDQFGAGTFTPGAAKMLLVPAQ